MAHPLDGCRAKITRAGDHLQTLDTESRRFVEEHEYIFVHSTDPDTREHVIVVRSIRQPPVLPPIRLGVLVGDVLHNLRSALDHLVWQLAIIGTGPAERRNQFPIFDDPEMFKQRRERYLHGVSQKHRARIEAYQPYKGGTEGQALTVLALLNDIDKHRVVHASSRLAMTGPESIKLTNVRRAEIRGRDITNLEDGAEVYRVLSTDIIDPNVEVKVQTAIRWSLGFGDMTSLVASRRDFLTCRDVVSNIVESFAPDFDAIGALHDAPPDS